MKAPLETAELQAFTRSVDARSLTLAARELGLPRATLGRRLARLEERLGVRLLRRTTRRIALTSAGATLYDHAKNVLEAARVAEASVHERDGIVRGDLRVSLPPIYDDALLGAVCAFGERHPDVRMHVTFTSKHVDLVRDADVALRASPSLEEGLVARTIRNTEMLAAASPAYLAARGVPRKASDLAGHDCLVFLGDDRTPMTQWPLKGGHTVRVQSTMASNSFALLREAARRGRGIALLLSTMADEDLRSGKLVRVLPDIVHAKARLALVYPERQLVAPAVRAFVEAMSAWARTEYGAPKVASPSGRARR